MARAHVHAAVLVVAIALAGCGGGENSTRAGDATVAAAATAAEESAPTVVDVRTPEEFGSGHVPGALNLDVQAPDFRTKAAELERSGRYLVYCRSGNRSAQATGIMRELGLEVMDGGGLEDMAAAGWRIDER